MYQIRVFVFVHPVSREINLLVGFVYVLYFPYIPFTFGDLVDGACRSSVVQIQVVVVIPLTRPDDTFAVVQVVAVDARIVDVFFFRFFDKRAYAAISYRHFKYPVDFVSAFVVFEGNSFAVVVPYRSVQFILVAEEFGRRYQPFAVFHPEDARHFKG